MNAWILVRGAGLDIILDHYVRVVPSVIEKREQLHQHFLQVITVITVVAVVVIVEYGQCERTKLVHRLVMVIVTMSLQ